ncbi:nuclear polyadenylated RNA-binding protein [Rhynchospora pubera]|uniref:Nuclear polyadenylated RNA-binding protein n=1 Tax=Rhynchospora pubera TaxID=906938 RepID=A0AAV8CWV4_9POAL|nr:nuclear polyadenylated RNA-binding protein [Rhynchospora pubera]
MRISFCDTNCTPINCVRSLFCCCFPSLVATKDAPNHTPIPNSNLNQNSSANPIPNLGPDAVSASIDESSSDEKVSALGEVEVNRKSCLKKSNGEKKGNVKWMDLLGKELVEIKEFETSDSESLDDIDGNTPCICSVQ